MNVISQYDDFLFAPICDEPGGMRLSVLSALARMNVDPWEEAAPLATLSTPDAERTLVSRLNLFPGKRQRSAETEILAGQLVALLPKASKAASAKAATIAGVRAQGNNYWFLWLPLRLRAMLGIFPRTERWPAFITLLFRRMTYLGVRRADIWFMVILDAASRHMEQLCPLAEPLVC